MSIWEKMDSIMNLAGLVVMASSLVSTFVNQKIRMTLAAGGEVDPLFLKAATVLNVVSANLDKAMQLGQLVKTKKAAGATNTEIAKEVIEEIAEEIEDSPKA